MADASGKKKAISAFFSKNKKTALKPAQQDADGGLGDGAAGGSSSVPPAIVLPGVLANSDAWVDAPAETTSAPLVASHLSTRVTELTDEDFEAETGRGGGDIGPADLEAEETKAKLWNAIKAGKKAASKAAKAEAQEAEAAKPVATGWRSRTAESKKTPSGPLNVKDTRAFPTLERAASGLPPGAQFADTSKSEIGNLGKATKWAALAGDDDEEEEEEEQVQQEQEAVQQAEAAAAAASEAAPAKKKGISFAAEPASALPSAVTSAAGSGPATDVSQLFPGSGAFVEDDAEVKKATESIIRELRSSRDIPSAIARIVDLALRPLESRRIRLVQDLLNAGLDSETPAERLAIRKVLIGLVPARAVTPAMLTSGVEAVTSQLDDIRVDIPRAEDYLAELLRGIVIGSMCAPSEKPCVPASVLPPSLASRMGIHNVAVEAVTSGLAAASIAADVTPEAKPEEGAAAPAPAASSEPAASGTAAVEEDDVDALFATAKKKKKSKAAAQ